MNKTEQLIAERQSTHGDIESNANLLYILNTMTKYDDSQVIQDTCMRMVNLKLARFISSGYMVKDSIDDALGYLKLAGDLEDVDDPEFSVLWYLAELGFYNVEHDKVVETLQTIIIALHNREFDVVEKLLLYLQDEADTLGLV